jgi:drug/metabolite transporter (DMT)-like permease
LVFFKRKKINPWGNNKLFLVLRGIFGVTALTIFFYTLQKLPLGSAITIQYLSPIFTALFGIFILHEKVKPFQWFLFLLAFIGIGIVKGFDPHITTPLLLLGVGSAVFSGLAYNCIRKVKDTDHPLVVVFYFPLIATPIMAVISIFSWVTPEGIEWLLLILVGVLTQIAQVNMTKALQSAEINAVISFKYVGIVFALGFDVLIFGVKYNYLALIGIAVVLAGVVGNVLLKKHFARKAKGSAG